SGIGQVTSDNEAGCQWTVSFMNPFLLDSIVFAPGNGGQDATFGDYAFNQLTTSPDPGPIVGAGLPGLVMALGGLLALARRRRSQAVQRTIFPSSDARQTNRLRAVFLL